MLGLSYRFQTWCDNLRNSYIQCRNHSIIVFLEKCFEIWSFLDLILSKFIDYSLKTLKKYDVMTRIEIYPNFGVAA